MEEIKEAAVEEESPKKEAKAAKKASKKEAKKEPGLSDIDGVGPKAEKILIKAGYDTVEKIKALSIDDLTKLDGIGAKTAEKIIKSAKEL